MTLLDHAGTGVIRQDPAAELKAVGMTAAPSAVRDLAHERISGRQADKFAERRAQLATAALRTLSELGYARTSLREIAQNSEFSHGVLHYYFADKVELITYAVRVYKTECVHRYDDLVATSRAAAELKDRFADAMVTTLREDHSMHRLWYDMRTQSFFENAFRDDVVELDQSLEQMIWRIVSRYAELAGLDISISSKLAYGAFDGVFQLALLGHLAGDRQAPDTLRGAVVTLLDRLIG